MKKSHTIIIRVSTEERDFMRQQAQESKNLSAHVIKCVRQVKRFGHLINQAEKLEKQGYLLSKLEVK
jgi:hypothetical protein